MARPVSSARELPGSRRGACRRGLAARAEELNRHSPDCQRFREQDRAFWTCFGNGKSPSLATALIQAAARLPSPVDKWHAFTGVGVNEME
jgi:hypothetical protein